MSRPWHLLPVTVLAILFYTGVLADYVLTQYAIGFYVDLFTAEQVAYFTDMPVHADAAWGIAAVAGLVGAVLMDTGQRQSAVLLGVAAVATVYLTVWLVLLASPPMRSVTGGLGDLVMIASAVAALLFWIYARALHARGVLP